MGIATKTRMTEDEFLRMPDDGRKWELVNGEPKEVATSVKHDIYAMRLANMINSHAENKGFITGSQAGYRMANGNIRCPDLAFTRYEKLPSGELPEGFGDFAPDLCIEIISPSEEPGEMMKKVREYFGAGAEQIWHLFPETKTVRVFISPEVSTEYHEDDEITGGDILPTFRCQVSEIFKLR